MGTTVKSNLPLNNPLEINVCIPSEFIINRVDDADLSLFTILYNRDPDTCVTESLYYDNTTRTTGGNFYLNPLAESYDFVLRWNDPDYLWYRIYLLNELDTITENYYGHSISTNDLINLTIQNLNFSYICPAVYQVSVDDIVSDFVSDNRQLFEDSYLSYWYDKCYEIYNNNDLTKLEINDEIWKITVPHSVMKGKETATQNTSGYIRLEQQISSLFGDYVYDRTLMMKLINNNSYDLVLDSGWRLTIKPMPELEEKYYKDPEVSIDAEKYYQIAKDAYDHLQESTSTSSVSLSNLFNKD